jgi:outer membrane protein TolC
MVKSIPFWMLFSTVFYLHGFSQGNDTLYIEDCYKAMVTNWPTSKNITLAEQTSELRTKNISSSWLPQVSINGQATYQSEVLQLKLPIPGLSIPIPSKDQYKATLDINQTIFDGGVTSERKKLENANLLVEKQQIAVDINQRKEQINTLFFNALLLQENEDLLIAFRKRLEEKQSVISSCVTNGILTESDLYSIQAELIKTDQQIADAKISRESILSSLSLLTGQNISKESKLGYKQFPVSFTDTISRPELQLFQLQQSRLDASSGISKKTLLPKLYAFGQAGYGRPGLNMLNDNFDSFYIVGAKLSWTLWDWNQSRRDRKVFDIQKNIISNQKDAFIKGLSVQSENELGAIKKMQILLDKDLEIIKLREKITASSSSKLQNGTIRSADYIDDITAETQAKIDMKKHQVQFMLAKFNYLIIKGLI